MDSRSIVGVHDLVPQRQDVLPHRSCGSYTNADLLACPIPSVIVPHWENVIVSASLHRGGPTAKTNGRCALPSLRIQMSDHAKSGNPTTSYVAFCPLAFPTLLTSATINFFLNHRHGGGRQQDVRDRAPDRLSGLFQRDYTVLGDSCRHWKVPGNRLHGVHVRRRWPQLASGPGARQARDTGTEDWSEKQNKHAPRVCCTGKFSRFTTARRLCYCSLLNMKRRTYLRQGPTHAVHHETLPVVGGPVKSAVSPRCC